MGTVVSIANMKGGVGKTTLCVNLAFELFRSGKKVLVVDNDPQFNATSALVRPELYVSGFLADDASYSTIYDVYEKPPRLAGSSKRAASPARDQFITTWTIRGKPDLRLDLLASRIELYETLRNPSQKEYLLDKFLLTHARTYDYVLIDCPPTPSVLTLSAFAASDFVLIPAVPDYFSTLGLAQFLGTLVSFKSDLHDGHDVTPLGLIFTRRPHASNPETYKSITRVKDALEQTRGDIEVPIFETSMSHFKVYEKALWQSVPVQQISGRGTRGKSDCLVELAKLGREFQQKVTAAIAAKKSS